MRELQLLLFILVSALAFLAGCDTTDSSFDESIPEVYSLTTRVMPEGGGRVNPDFGDFEVNTSLEIEAIPAEGYVFERWEGDLNGNTNPESVVIDDDKNITARFSPRDYPLNITISGEGSVIEVVESRPSDDENFQGSHQKSMDGNIQVDEDSLYSSEHEAGQDSQNESVNRVSQNMASATVRLKAEPEEGWYFDQWEGDLTGNVNPEVITVDEEKEVTAVFLREDTEGFSIRIYIMGEGEVNKNPDRAFFNDGDEVTLTANPDQGWNFIEWQGDLSGSENSKTVVVEESLNVTALFEETDDPAMKIIRQPSGTRAGTAITPAPQILLSDGLGDPVRGVEISVSLSNNSFTSESNTTVSTDGDGIATFDNLVIETAFSNYILTFDADEPDVSKISSTPFGVVAAPGDPSSSLATVPDGVAGAETMIEISVQDRYGNLIRGIADQIVVEISGANNEAPTVSETNFPGEYSASYTPVNTGIDDVSIELDGVPIAESPFESSVVSAKADATNSTATVPDGRAGEETEITIFVKDQFGNSVGNLAGELSVEVSGANSASLSVTESNSAGEYIASYTPERSGADQISIQLGGAPIAGSPFESDVTSAVADASNSSAAVPDGRAGEETTITIVLKDQFGNSVSNAAGELLVDVSGANNASPRASEANTPGEYRASYTPETIGTDRVSIQVENLPIDGSPFESDIVAAAVNPSNSVVSAEPSVLTVGDVSVITVQLRDRFENPIATLTENDFEISITGEVSAGGIGETSISGTYEFEVTTTTSGEAGVSVSANGITLDDTPDISFEPGEPDELIIISQPEDTRSGERIAGPPSVRVQDEFGNVIPGVDVTVSEERGSRFFEGTLTVTTNQSGVATFDDLVLNRIFGTFKLVFSVEGMPDTISEDFQVSPFLQ